MFLGQGSNVSKLHFLKTKRVGGSAAHLHFLKTQREWDSCPSPLPNDRERAFWGWGAGVLGEISKTYLFCMFLKQRALEKSQKHVDFVHFSGKGLWKNHKTNINLVFFSGRGLMFPISTF